MIAHEIGGSVHRVGEPEFYGSPPRCPRRSLVIKVDKNNYINVTFCNEKAKLLDALRVGEEIVVEFELKGRESFGEFYNTVNGITIKEK
jgi:hypothetical protein